MLHGDRLSKRTPVSAAQEDHDSRYVSQAVCSIKLKLITERVHILRVIRAEDLIRPIGLLDLIGVMIPLFNQDAEVSYVTLVVDDYHHRAVELSIWLGAFVFEMALLAARSTVDG